MGLKDLPVKPNINTDRVKETYIKELKEVTTPEALSLFAKRWAPLFQLEIERIPTPNMDEVTVKSYMSIIDGSFDATEALQCINNNRQHGCKHCKNNEGSCCAGAHLCLPFALLRAYAISERYGVTTDLAIIQANGGMEALEK